MKSPKNKMLSVHNNLQGLGILLIGGTVFLVKVWLSLFLKRFPNVGHIYLIVRSRRRADGSIRQSHDVRFWSEVATSPALNPLREGRSAKEYNDFINEKITVLDGDVTRPFGGLTEDIRDKIRGKVDVLVNSSGVVDFNPPLDKSLEVYVNGQLLLSGSSSGTDYDYEYVSASVLKFAFDLEADDIVQVIQR